MMKDEERQEGSRARKKNSSLIPHPSSFAFVVGFVTCPSRAEARKLAKTVLTKKLAACVNILDGMESHYWWQGKLKQSRECLLLIKTTQSRTGAATKAIKAAHSYEVPEVIFLPIASGERRYLQWINRSVEKRMSC